MAPHSSNPCCSKVNCILIAEIQRTHIRFLKFNKTMCKCKTQTATHSYYFVARSSRLFRCLQSLICMVLICKTQLPQFSYNSIPQPSGSNFSFYVLLTESNCIKYKLCCYVSGHNWRNNGCAALSVPSHVISFEVSWWLVAAHLLITSCVDSKMCRCVACLSLSGKSHETFTKMGI